jgi:hypothetical protein
MHQQVACRRQWIHLWMRMQRAEALCSLERVHSHVLRPSNCTCRSGGACLQARRQQALKAARLHRGGRLRDEVALQRRQHRRAHGHIHTLHYPPRRRRCSAAISSHSLPAVQLPAQQANMHVHAAPFDSLISMQGAGVRRAAKLFMQLSMISSPRRLTPGSVYTPAWHA